MSKPLEHYVREAATFLDEKKIADGITLFGEGVLRYLDECGQLSDLWTEFVRVELQNGKSMVFRVVSKKDTGNGGISPDRGVVRLIDEQPKSGILDTRANIEREVHPVAEIQDPSLDQELSLRRAYAEIQRGERAFLLTPVREGALGFPERKGTLQPYTNDKARYHDPWDVDEEIMYARMHNLARQVSNSEVLIAELRRLITENYASFALPLLNLFSSTYEPLHFLERPALDGADPTFFTDEPVERRIDIRLARDRNVEQIVAYPFSTNLGIIYVRVFKVWDPKHETYEMVRTLQTRRNLDNIYGIRVDSNCTDGMHSLDSHCDCGAQLHDVLSKGLVEGKSILVVQMCDHEGKGWGVVNKLATHEVVRGFNGKLSGDEKHISDVVASDAFYDFMGVHADMRNYQAAQLVINFLNINSTEVLLMHNDDKVKAVKAAGVEFNSVEAVHVHDISREAKLTLNHKADGLVKGANGLAVLYGTFDSNPALGVA